MKDPFGVFELVIPARDGKPAIAHGSKVKVNVTVIAFPYVLTRLDFYDHTVW